MITMVSRAGRVWAVIVGLVEIAAAFGHAEAAGTRALFILGGLITVAYLGDAAHAAGPFPRHAGDTGPGSGDACRPRVW